MSANCTPAQLKALTDFGYHVGLAFQVIDDILDVTQTSEKLGKTAGKDTKAQKATYPSIVGLEQSRKIAAQLTQRAFNSLKAFRGKPWRWRRWRIPPAPGPIGSQIRNPKPVPASRTLPAGVKALYPRLHVPVADFHLVDELELLDRLVLLPHALQHAAEVVDQLLLLIVEDQLLLQCVLQGAGRQVEHLPLGEALRQVIHRG